MNASATKPCPTKPKPKYSNNKRGPSLYPHPLDPLYPLYLPNGRGRGRDHQHWNNAFFGSQDLFTLVTAHAGARQSLTKPNH
jgi:hypothetical protein